MAAGYGEQSGDIAAQLAVHFERGGELLRAVNYIEQMADTATERNAHHEAVVILNKGLELLSTLPDSITQANYWLARANLKLGDTAAARAAFAATR